MSSLQALEQPMSQDDLPNNMIKDQQVPSDTVLMSSNPMEIASQFVEQLTQCLEKKDHAELLTLYDSTFKKYSATVFSTVSWPSASEIEEAQNHIEIQIEIQSLYNELVYRYKCASGQAISVEERYFAWLNYKDLFEMLPTLELPASWIWDIIDELVYQFQLNSQWRGKLQQTDAEYIELAKLDQFYTFESVIEILTQDLDLSKDNVSLFDLYRTVGLVKLYVMVGAFKTAIETVATIDFGMMAQMSKSFMGYINFYYHLGFSYLMTKCYKECVNIFEAIVLFTNKYKQFCSKQMKQIRSSSCDMMIRQSEKVLHSLTIALVLYPKKLDEITQNVIQEQLRQKFERLKQYDMSIFNEIFQKGKALMLGCPKFFHPYQNLNELKNDFNDYSLSSQTQIYKDQLAKNFLDIRKLNNVNNILKLYSRISLQKASKVTFQSQLLKVSVDELQNMLQKQRQRSLSNINESAFDKTVLVKFQVESENFEFSFENDMIIVREQTLKKNYQHIYNDYNQQIVSLIETLENE